jgi:tRNA dimethylallyltransferase
VVCGGTGFYLKNLILGLPEAPPADEAIRAELKRELKEKGAAALMEELARCDPVSAEKIHLNDVYRLLRALEVARLSGRPLSSFGVSGKNEELGMRNEELTPHCRYLVVGLSRPREELYCRINERCAAMFSQGLPDEVRRLYDRGYTPRDPGLRAIGYREFFVQDEQGSYRLSCDIPGVQALVAQNSRRYAKRQVTFFASLPGVQWLQAGDDDTETAERLKELIRDSHGGTEDTEF